MLLILFLPSVLARGPPGIAPPLSFIAESWYPSNLPTVKPPWRQPGVDINQFRTQEFAENNSVTSPMEETTAKGAMKTTKMREDFQEDGITEVLEKNSTDSSMEEGSGGEIVEVRTILESGEVLTTSGEVNMTEETTTERTRVPAAEKSEEEENRPFSGEETIFDIKEKSKTRGEGGLEKKKERKECTQLVFVIDSSGNVASQYEKQKDLVRLILLALGQQKRKLGLITYSSRRKQRWNISPNHNVTRKQYLKKLKKARFLGGVTATGAVLDFLTTETVSGGGKTTVVLLTDGFSFDEVEEPAENLRSSNSVELFITGDYFPLVRPVLNQIAGDPEHVFFGHRPIRRLIELLKC